MNIIEKLKEIKTYNDYHAEILELKNKENMIISNICNRFESMCKNEAYINAVMNIFSRDTYDVFLSMAQMSVMIQCINDNKKLLSYENARVVSHVYSYSRDSFPELDEFYNTIEEIIQDDKQSNSLDDVMTYCLLTTSNIEDKNLYHDVVFRETEYRDDWRYGDLYYLDRRYDRAIIAVYNMYKDNIDRILEIMRNNLSI